MSVEAMLQKVLSDFEEATGTPLVLLSRALKERQAKNAAERQRYAANPDQRIKSQLAWNKANPEKKAAADRKWRAKHGAEATRRCRERKLQNGNSGNR